MGRERRTQLPALSAVSFPLIVTATRNRFVPRKTVITHSALSQQEPP
ncbi:hypothetical protein FHS25_005253 [Rhizobium laguerreae]|uniref:Uncharacterized protein n=1 Tax=Rhizobium laguerreae TaxID=1076926 RepID=A0AAX2QHM2_9HYPH|nr:hypothetical protein [Rhizobium laguerreae]TCU22627.1 hypothetical protein EV131_108104 [Rhizobium laguerreae]